MENTKEEVPVVRPYLQVLKKMNLLLEKETWKVPYTIVTVDQPHGKFVASRQGMHKRRHSRWKDYIPCCGLHGFLENITVKIDFQAQRRVYCRAY